LTVVLKYSKKHDNLLNFEGFILVLV